MIIGKHEETIQVSASTYVQITIEEDQNDWGAAGYKSSILLFPEQAVQLVSQIEKAIEEARQNRNQNS